MSIGNELFRSLFSADKGVENKYFSVKMFPNIYLYNDNMHPLLKHWAYVHKKDMDKCDDMALLLNEALNDQEGE